MPLEIPSSYNISFLSDPAKPIESYFPSRFSPETARPALSGGVSRVERDMVPRQGGRKQPASAVGAAGPNHVNTGRLSKRKEVVELGPTSSTAVWSQVEGEGAQRGSSRSSATPKIDSTSSLHAAPSKIAISAPPPPFSLPFHPSQIPHVPPHSRLAPAQEPTLTHNLFSPSTRTLTFKSYAPYITQEPLELPWSSYYLEMLLRFLDDCFSTPGTRRHLESQQTSHLPIAQMLKSYQPNKQAIRAAVGELGTSKAYEGLTGHERYRIQALRNTMRWIWEDSGVRLEQAAWLVLEANKVKRLLPVYVLSAFLQPFPLTHPLSDNDTDQSPPSTQYATTASLNGLATPYVPT